MLPSTDIASLHERGFLLVFPRPDPTPVLEEEDYPNPQKVQTRDSLGRVVHSRLPRSQCDDYQEAHSALVSVETHRTSQLSSVLPWPFQRASWLGTSVIYRVCAWLTDRATCCDFLWGKAMLFSVVKCRLLSMSRA